MADWLDKASELEQQQRSQALAACRQSGEAAEQPGHCNDCGEAISPRRLAALPGVATCIHCQSLREVRGQRG
ncbi:TraR/DksA C4-type zinc finger protein [Ferrimonas sp.]|uniref:TraR/DksA C4-type zinc finger protein n=1 Tax=Ferrimonas sp. TaxID=2080861 RepID=UPI003A8E36FE